MESTLGAFELAGEPIRRGGVPVEVLRLEAVDCAADRGGR